MGGFDVLITYNNYTFCTKVECVNNKATVDSCIDVPPHPDGEWSLVWEDLGVVEDDGRRRHTHEDTQANMTNLTKYSRML